MRQRSTHTSCVPATALVCLGAVAPQDRATPDRRLRAGAARTCAAPLHSAGAAVPREGRYPATHLATLSRALRNALSHPNGHPRHTCTDDMQRDDVVVALAAGYRYFQSRLATPRL